MQQQGTLSGSTTGHPLAGNCIEEHHSAPDHSFLSRQLLQFFLNDIFFFSPKIKPLVLEGSGCRVDSILACWEMGKVAWEPLSPINIVLQCLG